MQFGQCYKYAFVKTQADIFNDSDFKIVYKSKCLAFGKKI